MRIIEIKTLDNGAHRNQNSNGYLPDGWAIIHNDMNCENFPFGNVIVEIIDGVPTVTSWEPVDMPEPVVNVSAQIAELKAQLESTDYKVIKCSEAQLVGEELPYDIVALHAERQALRDKINELEGGAE